MISVDDFPRLISRGPIEGTCEKAFRDFEVAAHAMNKKPPTSERVCRDLSAEEQKRLDQARAETEAIRDKILAQGRIRKRALEISRAQVRQTVNALRAERERLGLSLADIESRSGLKRSALSRLENDPTANPRMLTLQRYASAIGMRVIAQLESEVL